MMPEHSGSMPQNLPAQIGNAFQTDGQPSLLISTKVIAETTGKMHKHVLRDVRQMLLGLYGLEGQNFETMIADGPTLDHGGFQVAMDGRGEYAAEIILDRDHALTLVSGYDVKLRKRLIDKLAAIETSLKSRAVALPNFSDPGAAARAWAEQYDARVMAERTKAEIGTRREATAMNTASQATKKANALELELDRAKSYATVKRMSALYHDQPFNWRLLKQASIEMGVPSIDIFDANYGTVKAYHADVWREAYALEIPEGDAA